MLNLMTGKAFADAPTMTRGGFLRGILASGIAPTIALGAASLTGNAGAAVGRGFMRGVGARIAAAGRGNKLYDEELEFLQSGRSHYINTGVIPTENHGVALRFSKLERFSSDFNFIGTRSYSSRFMINASSGKFGCGYCRYVATSIPLEYNSENEYNVSMNFLNDRKFKVGEGQSINLTAQAVDGLSFFALFAQSAPGGSFTSVSYRIHQFSMSFGESEIMRLMPVIKGGIPCMYDEIGGGFYYNEVSGHQFGYKRKDGTGVDPT